MKKNIIVAVILAALIGSVLSWGSLLAVSPRDYHVIQMTDSGTVLTMFDGAQTDANVRDSNISATYLLEFIPQIIRCEYGVSYLNEVCSLGIDNDSGAPFWTLETRDHPDQPWRPWTLDSMHNVRDSFFNLTNDFADQDDTVWGKWIRVIEHYEMDCDSASAGSDEYDTLWLSGFRIFYYGNIH